MTTEHHSPQEEVFHASSAQLPSGQCRKIPCKPFKQKMSVNRIIILNSYLDQYFGKQHFPIII